MKRNLLSFPAGIALAWAIAPASLSAQNPNFAHGDLVLYFQQDGGSNTVYANLGNAATLFRGAASGPGAANRINFLNLGNALSSAFGAGWASDPTVYAGLAGVWGDSVTNAALQDGDPHRTIYVSQGRAAVGTVGAAGTPGYTVNTNTGMSNGSLNMRAMNNWFELNSVAAVEVVDKANSLIDDQNPFVVTGLQGTAYDIFGGGVQQAGAAGTIGAFGPAGTVEFALDLYRILARNNVSGQVAGPLREGTFEGTVTVNSSGMVSFVGQGAAVSGYDAWVAAFPALDTAAKRLPTADPDADGLSNQLEFVLDGNPAVADAVAPKLNAAGNDFVFTFQRRDDSEAVATAVFEYSTNLGTWTPAAIPAASATSGAVTIAISENGAAADGVTVTVPKSTAAGGRMFGRLRVSQ